MQFTVLSHFYRDNTRFRWHDKHIPVKLYSGDVISITFSLRKRVQNTLPV